MPSHAACPLSKKSNCMHDHAAALSTGSHTPPRKSRRHIIIILETNSEPCDLVSSFAEHQPQC